MDIEGKENTATKQPTLEDTRILLEATLRDAKQLHGQVLDVHHILDKSIYGDRKASEKIADKIEALSDKPNPNLRFDMHNLASETDHMIRETSISVDQLIGKLRNKASDRTIPGR